MNLPRQRCKSPLNTLPQQILGFRRDGRPIFTIAGGSEPPQQGGTVGGTGAASATVGGTTATTATNTTNPPPQGQQQSTGTSAPEEARDEHGAGLGFPKDTRTEDMTDAQKANYWRNQSKVQQKKAEDAERKLQGSSTVRDQQQDSGKEQVDATAIRSEAAQDAAMATIRSSLALRGKTADDIDSLVDVLSMAKFVTAEHRVDTAKVVAFIEKNAPAGANGGGGGSDFGAGRREDAGKDRKEAARAEAERRFAGQKDQPNRGHLGGLRR